MFHERAEFMNLHRLKIVKYNIKKRKIGLSSRECTIC